MFEKTWEIFSLFARRKPGLIDEDGRPAQLRTSYGADALPPRMACRAGAPLLGGRASGGSTGAHVHPWGVPCEWLLYSTFSDKRAM